MEREGNKRGRGEREGAGTPRRMILTKNHHAGQSLAVTDYRPTGLHKLHYFNQNARAQKGSGVCDEDS